MIQHDTQNRILCRLFLDKVLFKPNSSNLAAAFRLI